MSRVRSVSRARRTRVCLRTTFATWSWTISSKPPNNPPPPVAASEEPNSKRGEPHPHRPRIVSETKGAACTDARNCGRARRHCALAGACAAAAAPQRAMGVGRAALFRLGCGKGGARSVPSSCPSLPPNNAENMMPYRVAAPEAQSWPAASLRSTAQCHSSRAPRADNTCAVQKISSAGTLHEPVSMGWASTWPPSTASTPRCYLPSSHFETADEQSPSRLLEGSSYSSFSLSPRSPRRAEGWIILQGGCCCCCCCAVCLLKQERGGVRCAVAVVLGSQVRSTFFFWLACRRLTAVISNDNGKCWPGGTDKPGQQGVHTPGGRSAAVGSASTYRLRGKVAYRGLDPAESLREQT